MSSNGDLIKTRLLEAILKETIVLRENILSINSDVNTLKNTPYEITYKEELNLTAATGSTTGNITFPSGATLEENNYPGNAVLSILEAGGEISGESPRDTSGNIITASLDSLGNWVTTGNTNSRVAIIFTLLVKGIDIINLDETKVIDYFSTDDDIDFSNGITRTGNLVELGGDITKDTTIDGKNLYQLLLKDFPQGIKYFNRPTFQQETLIDLKYYEDNAELNLLNDVTVTDNRLNEKLSFNGVDLWVNNQLGVIDNLPDKDYLLPSNSQIFVEQGLNVEGNLTIEGRLFIN